MWANSSFEDLVQYNDGFKTGLIGTAEQVADRIMELKQLGLNVMLCGFLHYDWELENFGKKVIPLVREREAALKRAKCSRRAASKPRKRSALDPEGGGLQDLLPSGSTNANDFYRCASVATAVQLTGSQGIL
jgi:hypothetical protein